MGKGAQELRVTSIHQWFLHGPIPGRRSQAGSERLKRSEAVEVGCGVQLQVNLPLDSLAWKLRSPLFVEESSQTTLGPCHPFRQNRPHGLKDTNWRLVGIRRD